MIDTSGKKHFSLSKIERLNGRKAISYLMENGEAVKAYPFIVSYLAVPTKSSRVKTMFSVSKKKQKLAVRRNRIKRKLREAYRINKLSLYACAKENKLDIQMVIIQVNGEDIPYKTLEKKVIKALSRIVERESKKYDQE